MKKKIFVLTVAILVLAFSLLSFTACTSFDKVIEKASNVLDDVIAIDDAGTAMFDGKTYDMPRALKFYASSPNSNKTIRLTASITPAAAADKTVDWSVAWANPSSTWATGKTVTDYVTATPTSDGALTADVHFVANFGEQIIVTVTSREVSSVSTSCTVDCYQTFDSAVFNYRLGNSGQGNYLDSSSDLVFPSKSYFENSGSSLYHNLAYWAFAPSLSVSSDPYTIPLTSNEVRIYLKRSDSFIQQLCTYYQGTAFYNTFSSGGWMEVTSESLNLSGYEDQTYLTSYDFYHVLFSGALTTGDNTKLDGQGYYYYNRMVGALQNTTGPHFRLRCVVSFDGVGFVTSEYDVTFSPSSLGLVAQNLSLDLSSINF